MGSKLRSLYTSGMSVRMKDMFEKMEEASDERLSLANEIDTARMVAVDAMKLLAQCDEKDASPKAKAAALKILQGSIDSVAALVTQYVKIQVVNGSAIPMENVHHIIDQIARIIESEVDDQEIRSRIMLRMDNMTTGRQIEKPQVTITIE